MKRGWNHIALLGIIALFAATASHAQNSTFNSVITLVGGVGGAIDQMDAGLGNPTFQLGYSGVIDKNTMVSLRLGEMSFSGDEPVGELFDSSLTYVTIGGEYRSRQGFFSGALVESGVYVALGGYNLEGTSFQELEEEDPGTPTDPAAEPVLVPVDESDTSVGLAIGVVGDWEISRRWIFRFELSGHYALLDQSSLFAMAHAGFGFRF